MRHLLGCSIELPACVLGLTAGSGGRGLGCRPVPGQPLLPFFRLAGTALFVLADVRTLDRLVHGPGSHRGTDFTQPCVGQPADQPPQAHRLRSNRVGECGFQCLFHFPPDGFADGMPLLSGECAAGTRQRGDHPVTLVAQGAKPLCLEVKVSFTQVGAQFD